MNKWRNILSFTDIPDIKIGDHVRIVTRFRDEYDHIGVIGVVEDHFIKSQPYSGSSLSIPEEWIPASHVIYDKPISAQGGGMWTGGIIPDFALEVID